MSVQLGKQLEELKSERNKHGLIEELNNHIQEKDSQINFLISKLQSLESQREQMDKGFEDNKTLIGKYSIHSSFHQKL